MPKKGIKQKQKQRQSVNVKIHIDNSGRRKGGERRRKERVATNTPIQRPQILYFNNGMPPQYINPPNIQSRDPTPPINTPPIIPIQSPPVMVRQTPPTLGQRRDLMARSAEARINNDNPPRLNTTGYIPPPENVMSRIMKDNKKDEDEENDAPPSPSSEDSLDRHFERQQRNLELSYPPPPLAVVGSELMENTEDYEEEGAGGYKAGTGEYSKLRVPKNPNYIPPYNKLWNFKGGYEVMKTGKNDQKYLDLNETYFNVYG
jgi:hypothetical protein